MTDNKYHKLVKGCMAWDRQAQNELYRIFASKMFAVCFRYSKSREDAEDTFHEGFMKVYENIKSFRGNGSLEGWIRRIMVNTAIEKFRRQSNLFAMTRMQELSRGDGVPSTDSPLDGIEAKDMVRMIQQLPPGYKMVFNLYVFEGLKHREIAEHLGISEGTSKSNLSDAKAILKRKINAEQNAFALASNYHER